VKNIKKIYLDRIDNNYDVKNSLALGPWCFHEIKEIDEIYSYYKKKHFKIIDFKRNLLIKSEKNFIKKILFFLQNILEIKINLKIQN